MPAQAVVAARRGEGPDGTSMKVVRSRAPLRLGLAGGGTDVSPFSDRYGGVVLNATIDRYCYATLEERFDEQVQLVALDRGHQTTLGAAARDLPLHAATYERMCEEFELGSPSLTLTTFAEAPAGSGLGSSSTLVVALVEAFREYFALPLGEYEVARLAYRIERIDCGFTGGRQDQYAATFGGFNSMEFSENDRVVVNPLRIKPAIVHEFEASLVLYHTGVSRLSGAIIDEQVDLVERNKSAQIQATFALKDEAVAMKEALLVGDFHRMAQVLDKGWHAKRTLAAGISTPEIEQTLAVGMENGALAGKVSGAGGGGYILFIVEPLRRGDLLSALSSLPLGEIEPAHFVEDGAVAWRVR